MVVEDYLLAWWTGWTLDYIRGMDSADKLNMLHVIEGHRTAEAHQAIRAAERRR